MGTHLCKAENAHETRPSVGKVTTSPRVPGNFRERPSPAGGTLTFAEEFKYGMPGLSALLL